MYIGYYCFILMETIMGLVASFCFIKSCGSSICYDIALLTWLGQKAGTGMLPDKPGTWKIIAQLFLRIPLWAGALTSSPGDWHLREQPNDWPRHFFRKWLTKAANLDNRRRAPIKALWPSILPPGLGTSMQTHKWKKITPWGKSSIFIVCTILHRHIIHYL